jgi:jouberin
MRKKELSDVVVEKQLEKEGWRNSSKRSQKKKGDVDLRKMVSWGRLEGQSCKVPNKFLMALPSSPIESLNLTISGNVHSLKFSPCGLKLAAGLDTDDLHAILVFEIPSGHLLRSLKNHHGLIYDLNWAQVDISSNVYMQYLASASADSTACVWSMRNNDHTSLSLIKTLHHPSFVYAAKFHPTNHSLLLTACFDFIIRVWNIDKGEEDSNSRNDSSPLFLVYKVLNWDLYIEYKIYLNSRS